MDHLSRIAIERALVRTSSTIEPDADSRHLRSCEECQEREQRVLAERAAYLDRFPAAEFSRVVAARAKGPERRPARWAGVPAWTAAAAIVAGALVLWQGQRPAPVASQPREVPQNEGSAAAAAVRIKGSPSRLDAYVKGRVGNLELLRNGETLVPGDQLAFVVTLAEPRYVLLIGVDAAGSVTRYHPPPDLPAALQPAGRAQLPAGVELDDARGSERLVALFSRKALDESAVRSSVAAALAARPPANGGDALEPLNLQLDADEVEVWFRK